MLVNGAVSELVRSCAGDAAGWSFVTNLPRFDMAIAHKTNVDRPRAVRLSPPDGCATLFEGHHDFRRSTTGVRPGA